MSASSAVSILFGVVSAKVMAVVLLPAGYGFYSLLQSFVGLVNLVASLGIMIGLVREGAGAVTSRDELAIASLRKAAWVISCGMGILVVGVLATFRQTLSRLALGTSNHPTIILLMGIPVLFMLASGVQAGTLNAYHRVEALAKCSVGNTALGATWSITCLLVWGVRGIVPAVIGTAGVGCLVSGYLLHHEVGPARAQPKRHDVQAMAWSLLRFGGPYTASQLVGAGVQLALPMMVVHLLGTESVGYYRAAIAVTVVYSGLLTTAMGQDFYPRVAAVKDQPRALVDLINQQHRLVMILAVPAILGTLALAPYAVPLVYSRRFMPAVGILAWQLIGDLFKLSSWTMSYAILARCRTSVYLLTESVGGVANIATFWLAVHRFGLPGLGISFLATYIIYYAVVWLVLRREIHLVWTTSNKMIMLAGVAAALLVRALPSTGLASLKTPIALSLALLAAAWSLRAVWGELWGDKEVRTA